VDAELRVLIKGYGKPRQVRKEAAVAFSFMCRMGTGSQLTFCDEKLSIDSMFGA